MLIRAVVYNTALIWFLWMPRSQPFRTVSLALRIGSAWKLRAIQEVDVRPVPGALAHEVAVVRFIKSISEVLICLYPD